MQVFLSYSWNNREAADEIQRLCQRVGIKLIRDNMNLNYSDNIPEFANKINKCDFVICLISEDYLKSFRCMYEALVLLKNSNFKKKICCISVSKLKTDAESRIEYITYWSTKVKQLKNKSKNIKKKTRKSIEKDLKIYIEIEDNIGDFLYYVDNYLYVTINDIYMNGISKFLKTVVKKMGFSPYAHIEYLADISEEKSIQKQEELLEKYLIEHHENEYFYYVKANIYERKKYFDLALYYYEKSIAFNSNYILAYEALINLLLSKDDTNFRKIYCCLEKIKEYSPTSSCIYRINGILLMRKKNFYKAIKFLQQYLDMVPTDYTVCNLLGTAYEKLENPKYILKAKKQYEKAIEIKDDYYQSYNNLAIWYLRYKEDYEKCIYFCDKCLEINPNYYYAYNVKGLALTEQGHYQNAFDELCTSLLLSPPQHPLPINNMGYLIEKGFKSYDVAKLFYLNGMNYKYDISYLNYAMISFKQTRDYNDVIRVTDEGLKLNYTNVLLHFLQALAHFEIGNFCACLRHCDTCILIDDTYWPAYFIKLYRQEVIFEDLPLKIQEAINTAYKKLNIDYSENNYNVLYKYVCNHFNELHVSKIDREVYMNIHNLNNFRTEAKKSIKK